MYREERGLRMNRPLNVMRRSWEGGSLYLIKNESDKQFDDWVWPAVDWKSAVILDPLSGTAGTADVKIMEPANAAKQQLRLQLAPGQTVFIKTFHAEPPANANHWRCSELRGEATTINGPWTVAFVAGGPQLPTELKLDEPASWTKFAGSEGERFAGTARYTTAFAAPAGSKRCLLDLGKVADSAQVELNGKPVATLITAPFTVELADLKPTGNKLAVEVTNVAANRIRDLDRRSVPWKIFKDINIVDINYRPLDASRWPVREAGLLGPVTIQPLETQSKRNY